MDSTLFSVLAAAGARACAAHLPLVANRDSAA